MEINLDLSECQADLEQKLSNLSRRQSCSLFDIVIEDKNDCVNEKEYQDQLKNELKEWQALLQKAKSQINASIQLRAENGHVINEEILLPDQKNYINEEMPDLQKFVNDSAAFQIQAYNYLHDFNELEEKQEQLAKFCVEMLEKTAKKDIEKCLNKNT